jgi:hypothetical protein
MGGTEDINLHWFWQALSHAGMIVCVALFVSVVWFVFECKRRSENTTVVSAAFSRKTEFFQLFSRVSILHICLLIPASYVIGSEEIKRWLGLFEQFLVSR